MPAEQNRFTIYTDEELMGFVCSGEVQAFDALYDRYGKRLLTYFVRMLNFDRNIAEDALQDLFLKIAESPEKFDQKRSFKTWVFSVASNYCKNHYRHRQMIKNNAEHLQFEQEKIHEDDFLRLAGKLDGKVFRILLEETLKLLPPEKREAFLLRYQENKSISEIAEIQHCPKGSVKSRLHYTLKILEEKLFLFKPVNN